MTKKKLSKDSPGTQVLAVVHINYTQINVSPSNVAHVVEELSQLILSDYYRQYVPGYNGDSEG